MDAYLSLAWKHRAIVYGALKRLQLTATAPDYADLFQEGLLRYRADAVKRQLDWQDADAVMHFNRYAVTSIYYHLLHQRQAQRVEQQRYQPTDDLEALLSTVVLPPNVDDLTETLWWRLRPQQRQVLDLRLTGMSDTQVGRVLNLSRARVGQIRKQIQDQYRALQAQLKSS
ncbi:MAG: hypothetical protein LKJ69_10725 [Lactobacillus sp.]|jgi:DNA-directed RNA polymerase specialized sigma subunit|nr:hypothetical protein [Lactobacillus sp.]